LSVTGNTPQPLAKVETIDLSGRRVPIVALQDGEEGLLDNLGSIVGVRQESLALRKFSKCGTPRDVYAYLEIDAAAVVEACGKVLAETALEKTRLSEAALRYLAERQQEPRDASDAADWRQLWVQ
jgi:pyruvate dehydrogenase E1 component